MHRDQPPCNTCTKHECRNCIWTSPLDASYHNLLRSTSLISILALAAGQRTPTPSEPSWLSIAAKRLVDFFKDNSPRAEPQQDGPRHSSIILPMSF